LPDAPPGKPITSSAVPRNAENGSGIGMLQLNPSLEFLGSYHGGCSGDGILDDEERVLAEIREKKPDFIWVSSGTEQYGWIHRVKPLLDRGVLLAVGFAFDVNAGIKPDAPMWMQRLGLTWAYRMGSEPGRLAGRYLSGTRSSSVTGC